MTGDSHNLSTKLLTDVNIEYLTRGGKLRGQVVPRRRGQVQPQRGRVLEDCQGILGLFKVNTVYRGTYE